MQADTEPPQNPENPVDPTTAETAQENPAIDPWEELEADVAKWKELSLRTAAEMDNLRKRTARLRYAGPNLGSGDPEGRVSDPDR